MGAYGKLGSCGPGSSAEAFEPKRPGSERVLLARSGLTSQRSLPILAAQDAKRERAIQSARSGSSWGPRHSGASAQTT